jgi:DNA-binding LacI/PurR family transcriptional regulator
MTTPPRRARRGIAAGPVINDVARLAGVSHQTVSRVLNDHPKVSELTRARVLEAVQRLHYRPNALARGLAGRRSWVIGVVSFDTILHGPAATLHGVERAARAAGYGVSIASLEQPTRDGVRAALDALADQSVAGVVVIAPQSAVSVAAGHHRTAMVTAAAGADPHSGIPAIGVDQVAGAALAVRHLLNLGHRTVWHVSGPPDWLEARRRIDGWRTALEQAGRHVPEPLVGDWSARSGYAAGVELAPAAARGDVTAVFAANDQTALGLMRALREHGVRVPGDVSLVGFDDIPEAEFLWPPLTTVRQDFDEIGRRCVAALLRSVEATRPDGSARPAPDPVIAPTLVLRRSTTCI